MPEERRPQRFGRQGCVAHLPATGIHEHHIAVNDILRAASPQEIGHCGGVVECVARVQEEEIIAVGSVDALVHGVVHSIVRLADTVGDNAGIPFHHLPAAVGGSAINDYPLHISNSRLGGDAAGRALQTRGIVEIYCHHRQQCICACPFHRVCGYHFAKIKINIGPHKSKFHVPASSPGLFSLAGVEDLL